MRKKLVIIPLITLVACFIVFAIPTIASADNNINILLNGKVVDFTDDSGYPYVDENNRTMVPLRITMESAGFAVGYDSQTHTAIVITDHNRIEVPIGTNKVYVNNQLIENDTIAVVKNGRTYLPIRAVLENAGYTVEWANDTKIVNAYTYDFDANEFMPYSTSSLTTLLSNILKGNVIYYQGQYYATPDYIKMLTNVQVHYLGNDLNTAIYPQADRYDLVDFDFETAYEEQLESEEWLNDLQLADLTDNLTFGFVGIDDNSEYEYGFFISGSSSKTLLILSDYTYEIAQMDDYDSVFNGIRIKRVDGENYYNQQDLRKAGIIR